MSLLLWPLALIQRPEAESPLWARRILILLISGLTFRYLHWRCTASLNLDSTASTSLSDLLLLAESWLLITGLLPLGWPGAASPTDARKPKYAIRIGRTRTGDPMWTFWCPPTANPWRY